MSRRRNGSTAILALLAALVLLALASPSAFAREKLVYRALPGYADDGALLGGRYVISHTLGRRDARVFDTRRWVLKTFRYPLGCSRMEGVYGRSSLLFTCKDGSRIVRLGDRKTTRLPVPPAEAGSGGWDAVGTRWMEKGEFFVSRVDGHVEQHPFFVGGVVLEFNLDAAVLRPFRLCDPFHQDGVDESHYQQYDGSVVVSTADGGLALGRCGSSAPPRKLTTLPVLGSMSLEGGWTAWRRKGGCTRYVGSWDLRRRVAHRWIIPNPDGRTCALQVLQTRYALVVMAPGADRPYGDSEYINAPRLLVAHRP